MGSEMVTLDNMQAMAKAVAASGLWKSAARPEQALGLMLLCQAEGIHPMMAVRRYDLIQGTPTLKSEAQLAEFYSRGGVVKWMQRTAEVCEAKFSHPKHCPDGVVIRWTIEDAKRANLLGKENWRNYPRQMLSARVQAEGVQVVDPGAGLGMLTPEEAIDVQNGFADQAAEAAAALTGEPRQELTALPEVSMTDAESKKARAELNKALQAAKTREAFRAACLEFQSKYTRAIWVKATGHKEGETFQSFAKVHEDRVNTDDLEFSPEGLAKWRETVLRASAQHFPRFQEQYNAHEELQTQENQEALFERGRELGIAEYLPQESEDSENEITKDMV